MNGCIISKVTSAFLAARPGLVAAVLTVAVVAVGCGNSGRPELTNETLETATSAADGTIVSFGFDDSGPLGSESTDRWVTVSGEWAVVDGMLTVAQSGEQSADQRSADQTSPDLALATFPMGASDGFLQVTLSSVANQAGLVFRFSNPENYWYVTVAPDFGSWNVVKVIDGKRKPVGDVGVAPVGDSTSVGVFLDGPDITVMLDGKTFDTITDRTHVGATSAGLLVGWRASESVAAFDDVLVLAVNQAEAN